MPSTVVGIAIGGADARPAREPDAVCDRCGRRGTDARVTRASDPPAERRYCRRCWPAAHRRHIAAREAAVAAWFRAFDEAVQGWARAGRPGPPVLPPAPPGATLAWHWSLALGTHWREARPRAPATPPPAGYMAL
jgi:hypothetical protein